MFPILVSNICETALAALSFSKVFVLFPFASASAISLCPCNSSTNKSLANFDRSSALAKFAA